MTGEEYYSTIYTVKESPLERGVIWVGANDGPVSVTRDAGKTWQRVTPPGIGPGGRVQTVEPSPHRRGKAYVSILRYQLGDWRPYAFRTTDYGKTWTRITTGSNGIPADWPVRVVREDPTREGLLYAGTEYGLFISFDDGAHWQAFQQNLPVTPVTDIAVYRNDLALSTMGRGFWMLDDLSPLHQLTPAAGGGAGASVSAPGRAPAPLFDTPELGPAIRMHPRPGMNIDYSLAGACQRAGEAGHPGGSGRRAAELHQRRTAVPAASRVMASRRTAPVPLGLCPPGPDGRRRAGRVPRAPGSPPGSLPGRLTVGIGPRPSRSAC